MSQTVGIIIPPPDIRKLADKMAEFVAKNGQSFEDLVIKAESNSSKFSFVNQNDPYRPYYSQKVQEYIQIENQNKENEKQKKEKEEQEEQQKINQQQEQTKYGVFNRKVPTQDRYLIQHPIGESIYEIDIIKHTAQFVAKNGQKFLVQLTEREKQNAQFDFLKPTHTMFSFFTSLVDSYSKSINMRKDDIQKVKSISENEQYLLRRAGERFDYEHKQKMEQKKKDQQEEEERQYMQMIDWQDFIVVETIDFFDEQLPAPQQQQQQQQQQKQEEIKKTDEIKKEIGPQANPPRDYKPLDISGIVKKKDNYQAVQQKVVENVQKQEETVKCPVCNQQIPSKEINEHLRIELLDPKYKQIKEDVQNRQINNNIEISENLQAFAQKRPDIFGNYDENIVKEDQNDEQKQIWDGQHKNMTRTTANIAMSMQQNRKNLEETMKVSQTQNRKLPNLINLGQTSGVNFNLSLKIKVQGQQVQLEVDPNMSVYSLKQMISRECSINTEKIRLSVNNKTLKDSLSLANQQVNNQSSIEFNYQ